MNVSKFLNSTCDLELPNLEKLCPVARLLYRAAIRGIAQRVRPNACRTLLPALEEHKGVARPI